MTSAHVSNSFLTVTVTLTRSAVRGHNHYISHLPVRNLYRYITAEARSWFEA